MTRRDAWVAIALGAGQIARCRQRGPSPQNYALFDRSAFRCEGRR